MVFSDVVLPGQGGVWLVDQLKKKKPGLEILLASGYSAAMDQQVIIDRALPPDAKALFAYRGIDGHPRNGKRVTGLRAYD